MEEEIISIPKRNIKMKTKNIPEAIKKLNEVGKNLHSKNLDIINKFAGIAKSDSKTDKSEWYNQ